MEFLATMNMITINIVMMIINVIINLIIMITININVIITNIIINVMIKRVGSTFQTVRESRIPDRQLFLSNFRRERGLSTD